MDNNAQTVLLTVDIQANNTRLVELQKQLNEAKAALVALNQAGKDGKLSADEVAAGQVNLAAKTKATQQEMAVLTKSNMAQEAANKAATGSVDELKARLVLATNAYNALSVAERDNSVAGLKLQAETKAINDELSRTGQNVGDFRRNVGNYAGSIGPLIQELVKLQEQQKKLPEGTKAYDDNVIKVKGFQQAVNDAGVKAGLTFDQTQAKIANYGTAIQPVTAKLVQLESEQKKVGEGSAEYAKIGFQIGAVKKELEKIPEDAAKLGDSIKTGATLGKEALGPLGDKIEASTGLFSKYKNGSDLVKKGMELLKPAGETGAQGFKSVAAGIALTGLGVFLLLLGSVVTYFTSTNEGSKILKQGLAGLGAVVTVLTNLVTGLGKGLVSAAKDPKQAFEDLLHFIEDNVVNRFKAVGVIIEAIKTGNLVKLADGVIQLNTGVTDGLEKMAKFSDGIRSAATSAAELEAQQQKLKKSRAELEISEVAEKGRVEELIRLSKDRTLSAADRLGKLRQAGALEAELSKTSLEQTSAELALLQKRNAAKGLSTTADEIQEERDKRKEYNQTVADRNNTLATIKARQSRFVLEESAELKKAQKERADAAQKAREDAVKNRQTEVEQQLLAVKKGSAEELTLLQKKVDLAAELTLTSEKKTQADRKLILSKAEVDKQDLADEFAQKAAQIEQNRLKAAETEQKREYDENAKYLQEYLDKKRLALDNALKDEEITQKEYDKRKYEQDKAGLTAQLVLAKDYGQKTDAIDKALVTGEEARLRQLTATEKAENLKRLNEATEFGSALGSLVADTLTSTGASFEDFTAKVLILILDSLEKTVLASQVEAVAKAVGSEGPIIGAIDAAARIAVITAAFEGAKAVLSQTGSKQFAEGAILPGGVLSGPSHAQGGIPFSIGGRLGFEAEGGEAIMSKGAVQQFAPLLSHLNFLGGGKKFANGAILGLPSGGNTATDGGLIARHLAAQAGIDYSRFAYTLDTVLRRQAFETSVRTQNQAVAAYNRPRDLFTLR